MYSTIKSMVIVFEKCYKPSSNENILNNINKCIHKGLEEFSKC
jgi:hypothetical protein